MKTWDDLWKYLCDHGMARNNMQFYCSKPNETAQAFWNGMLCVLEAEGLVTNDDANVIWNEIVNG